MLVKVLCGVHWGVAEWLHALVSKTGNYEGSSPPAPTKIYNMGIKFKYKGKLYSSGHPENKLKKLGITWNDVEIIEEKEVIEYLNPVLYEFKNHKTGGTILSIYDNLEHLKDCETIEDWKFIGIKKYNLDIV